MSVVFGYRNVADIPLCPCHDPGNYVALETDDEGDLLRCWCGRFMRVTWDSPEERSEFIAKNGGVTHGPS